MDDAKRVVGKRPSSKDDDAHGTRVKAITGAKDTDDRHSRPDEDSPVHWMKVYDDPRPIKMLECRNKSGIVEGLEEVRHDPHPLLGRGQMKMNDLRKRVEPWLTSLFQSEHLSLLVGSGLTNAVHCIACNSSAAGMNRTEFAFNGKSIKAVADESARKAGRKEGNCEDDLRVANELLRGLEILGMTEVACKVRKEISDWMLGFARDFTKRGEYRGRSRQ